MSKAVASIEFSFPDGSKKQFPKGVTGSEIAKGISEGLLKAALGVKLDGEVLDLSRPLENGGNLYLITPSKMPKEANFLLWHSSSHVLAEAVLKLFPKAKLAIGPAIDEGFYYDIDVEKPFTPEDLEKIENEMYAILKHSANFERKEISRTEALKKFAKNPYKVELIKDIPTNAALSTYKDGSFEDLCAGPHLPNTSFIKAVKLLRVSGAYWRGSEKNKMLQRIYGISFFSEKEKTEWLKLREEAEKRNHLKLGKELKLFAVFPEAPGSPFYLPNGTIVYNELVSFMREKLFHRNYREVITPLLLSKNLWLQSGHWEHYKENMYFSKVDGQEFALKPMNCPGHIMVFKSEMRSYRDLPMRIGEFGMVHRRELSGVLNGLLRSRKLEQDDAHIFCVPEQIQEEVLQLLHLSDEVYKAFGFSYTLELSTKPEKAMGSAEQWRQAEDALANALKVAKKEYQINAGDGAFYGPKIDIHIQDSIGRKWQCGTIQLDFQMPQKFGLEFVGNDDKTHTPVMIHRTILGSLGRFMGVLIEHFAGNFPLWLSPEQVRVLPVSDKFNGYADSVVSELRNSFVRAEADVKNNTVSYKVRDAQLQKVPLILVVGEKEQSSGTVTVRWRTGELFEQVPLKSFVEQVQANIASRSLVLPFFKK